ncbi:MAG: phosphoenolpyruvate carboxykinase (ATP) [Fimbriimonadaceae bacterium]
MASTSTDPTACFPPLGGPVFRNLTVPELVEHALRNGEGVLSSTGALVTRTGKYTGRSPKDKAIVLDAETESKVWWENNPSVSPETFDRLWGKARAAIGQQPLYQVDSFGGTDPRYRIAVRFLVQKAWHALFVRQLLVRPSAEQLREFEPDWTVLDVCDLCADPIVDGTRSEAFIGLDFSGRRVLIMGTGYAGEMKKSIFTVLNYVLPLSGVLSMHCSANIGPDGDTALFFGLSGTGKTTLSADPERRLIGDDEHGWTDQGVFNFEGGCYAKCIKLSAEGEPQIYNAIRFGSVLENVVLRDDRVPDYDDGSVTENTRCAYPVEYIDNAVLPSVGGHPKNICFLTCDAFGVLPPISRLTAEQAMFHFLNGYTAKVAGTEDGVNEPQATFSTCFGAPFLPLPPKVYGDMLAEKIRRHGSRVWLVNTGWTGGGYGVGRRMPLKHTRAMIRAALSGHLDDAEYQTDPVFGLSVPKQVPGVPADILMPRLTWSDRDAYDTVAAKLEAMFQEQHAKFVS